MSLTSVLFAPMIFLAPYQKILGFRLYYLSGEVDTFLSLKTWCIQNKMMIFYFQFGMRVFDTNMFFFPELNFVFLSIDGLNAQKLQSKNCVTILVLPFSVMLIQILVNEDHSLLITSSIILHLQKLGTIVDVLHLQDFLSTLFLL